MTAETPSFSSGPVPDHYNNYEAISRGKREWERTFDAVSDLILIIDTDHTISRANRAMAERCGLPLGDLPGRKCYEVFHRTSQPPCFCPFARLMEEGCESRAVIEETALGAVFDVTVSPLYEAGVVRACVHVARDITEQKRHEAERSALEHQLQQAQKLESLGVLAGGIAHDFNNILMIILGHCFLESQEFEQDAWETSRWKQVEVAANRASDLCRQLLAYVGRMPLVRSEIDLAALVKEVLASMRGGVGKNVALEHHLGCGIPIVLADNGKIRQALMNLVTNAVEALGGNKGTVSIHLSRVAVNDAHERDFFGTGIPAGSYAKLDVIDSGCGIAQELQARIFDPFFTTKFVGRGLGLSEVIGILKSHSGFMQFYSEVGNGTRFSLYFPLCDIRDRAESVGTTERGGGVPSPGPAARAIAMVVDDEAEVRVVAAAMTSRMGYLPITARNGREAVDIFRARSASIDLIVMDLTMPEMDGIEAYREIRKESATVPVIMCSGYGNEDISRYTASDARAAVLAKPYTETQLRDALAAVKRTEHPPLLGGTSRQAQ